jgi:purine-binding chemotaxis protein CheW
MKRSGFLVIFSLSGQRFALFLESVERVVRSAEITPLPQAPDIVLGAVNMHGRIIPVMNIRKRFRLPEREIEPGDYFIVAHTSRREVAIVVDNVTGLHRYSDGELVGKDNILPEMEYIEGVVKLKDGMALIHDIDRFLSLDEESALDKGIG